MSKFIDMQPPQPEVAHRVLFILHKGLSDLRYLAKGGKNEQAYELADTLENIPGLLVNWKDGHLQKIEQQLQAYQSKYRDVSWQDYAKYIARESPPGEF